MNYCMYDRFEECFGECEGCPVSAEEPDPDDLRDYYMDEFDYNYEEEVEVL